MRGQGVRAERELPVVWRWQGSLINKARSWCQPAGSLAPGAFMLAKRARGKSAAPHGEGETLTS